MALDPGVRTFQTCYDLDGNVTEWGKHGPSISSLASSGLDEGKDDEVEGDQEEANGKRAAPGTGV